MKPIKYLLEDLGVKATEKIIKTVDTPDWYMLLELFYLKNIRLSASELNALIHEQKKHHDFFTFFTLLNCHFPELIDQHLVESIMLNANWLWITDQFNLLRSTVDHQMDILGEERTTNINKIKVILREEYPDTGRKIIENIEKPLKTKREAQETIILLHKSGIIITPVVLNKVLALTTKNGWGKFKNFVGLYLLCQMLFFHGKLNQENLSIILEQFHKIKSQWNKLLSNFKITASSSEVCPDQLYVVASSAFNKVNEQCKWGLPYLHPHCLKDRPVFMAIQDITRRCGSQYLQHHVETLLELERVWITDMRPSIELFLIHQNLDSLKKLTHKTKSFASFTHHIYQSYWMTEDSFMQDIAYLFSMLSESIITQDGLLAVRMEIRAEKLRFIQDFPLLKEALVEWLTGAIQMVSKCNDCWRLSCGRQRLSPIHTHSVFFKKDAVIEHVVGIKNQTPILIDNDVILCAAIILGLTISIGFILSHIEFSSDYFDRTYLIQKSQTGGLAM